MTYEEIVSWITNKRVGVEYSCVGKAVIVIIVVYVKLYSGTEVGRIIKSLSELSFAINELKPLRIGRYLKINICWWLRPRTKEGEGAHKWRQTIQHFGFIGAFSKCGFSFTFLSSLHQRIFHERSKSNYSAFVFIAEHTRLWSLPAKVFPITYDVKHNILTYFPSYNTMPYNSGGHSLSVYPTKIKYFIFTEFNLFVISGVVLKYFIRFGLELYLWY